MENSSSSYGEPPWSVNSFEQPYPGMNRHQLIEIVLQSFESKADTKALANAYGWLHPKMILELIRLGQNSLRSQLQNTSWLPGNRVGTYYREFRETFPYVADSFRENYGAIAVSNHSVEAVFSLTARLSPANAVFETVQMNIQQITSFKKSILRSMPDVFNLKNGTKRKPMRADASTTLYIQEGFKRLVIIKAATMGLNLQRMTSRGKHAAERALTDTHTNAEMAANLRTRQRRVKITEIADLGAKYDATKRSGTTTILPTQNEAFEEAGTALSVKELKAYLLDKGVGFPVGVRKYPRDADDENTPNLVAMYVAHQQQQVAVP